MLPSTFMSPGAADATAGGFDFSVAVFFLMATLMGLVLRALFGVFQWFELRNHTRATEWWVLANALGWMAGMVAIFLGAPLSDTGAGLGLMIIIGTVLSLLSSLLVGAITDLFLVRLEYDAEQALA